MENVYSKLKGKKLCNLIANIIIEEFKSIDKKNKTRIFVTKHNNFFVIDGMTTINTPINISEVVNRYMISKTEDEKYSPLNFIVDLNFTTTNLIVTGNWLESLVRDVFPFKINEIIQHLNLDDYNFEGEVLELDNYPWKKRDKVSEMVLM